VRVGRRIAIWHRSSVGAKKISCLDYDWQRHLRFTSRSAVHDSVGDSPSSGSRTRNVSAAENGRPFRGRRRRVESDGHLSVCNPPSI
jgi:hypothetical protein